MMKGTPHGNNMEKSNYKEWSVDFNGKIIKVTNWFNLVEMKGSEHLYIDDEHLDKNTDLIANPNIALFSKYEFSEDIKSIEVYAAGTFKVKISIMINGEIVLQDKLSFVDRLFKAFFPKNDTK